MPELKEVVYPLRFPRSLWKRIAEEAHANERTIAAQIRFSVQRDLNLRSDSGALVRPGRPEGENEHGG